MSHFREVKNELQKSPKIWLITGVAGFIGSNLLEQLLILDQKVVGLDNFLTGHKHNLDEVKRSISKEQWSNFVFIEGDIQKYEICKEALKYKTKTVDFVLHQAALGSVPRSISNPILTNSVNVTGFLNMLTASKDANVKSFTYASSSSIYGNNLELPKVENKTGDPLSPYAVTKHLNEKYAEVFAKNYGFKCIGLRYFNVFGKRQDPNGPYAAVIPKWTSAMINNKDLHINGDGMTSRDFSYVDNIVQMNILAALARDDHKDEIYNAAVGDITSLNELFYIIKESLIDNGINVTNEPIYRDFRPRCSALSSRYFKSSKRFKLLSKV